MLTKVELQRQQELGIHFMSKGAIKVEPIALPLDVCILRIKYLEEEINWEAPGAKDFLRMVEMRSLIKGLDIPEEVIARA